MDDDVKRAPVTVVSEFGVFISNCFRLRMRLHLRKGSSSREIFRFGPPEWEPQSIRSVELQS